MNVVSSERYNLKEYTILLIMEDETDNTSEFRKVVVDFAHDLLNTFPELNDLLSLLVEGGEEVVNNTKTHCENNYPKHFFDILYQNDEMFERDQPLLFLPGIDFRNLWRENITETTRTTIWKYLQLILFTSVKDMSDVNSFGDAAKLFEAIDEDDLKSKLESTINQLQECFDGSNNFQRSNMPDAEKIHEHVSSMMDGKLGSLAKEIAEETAAGLNIDVNDESSVDDVFKKLLKDPSKLMTLVQSVGGKLDQKMKSGDIKESELIAEASEIMKNMKNMPGMENFQDILGKMGINGKEKMNMGAMQAQMNRNLSNAKQRERLKKKLDGSKTQVKKELNNESEITQATLEANTIAANFLRSEGIDENGIENAIFSTGEKYEKSSKKKKKKKKKKN